MNWRHDALCAGEDPELFFPEGTAGPALVQTEAAKAVCAGCPVRQQCLRFALDSGQDQGVWAGTTPNERRELRSQRTQATRRISTRPPAGNPRGRGALTGSQGPR